MFETIAILLCLFCNALLAGAETAFISVSRPALKELLKKGNKEAELLLRMRENPERTLSVIQVGITFVGALAAGIGGAGAEETIAPFLKHAFSITDTSAEIAAILVVVIPLTAISVVVGELVPKTFALRRPLFSACKASYVLHKLDKGLGPVVTIFEWITRSIINLFPKQHAAQEEPSQVEIAAELQGLSPTNRQYVVNILRIEQMKIASILVDWKDVVYVDEQMSVIEIEAIIIGSRHTRLPVVSKGTVIGIINAKEFLAFQKTNSTDWLSLIRPVLKLTSATSLLAALQLMQTNRSHLAVVYKSASKDGKTFDETSKQGIVTMEAIFEEIIGDIYDEDDDGNLRKILESIHFKKH